MILNIDGKFALSPISQFSHTDRTWLGSKTSEVLDMVCFFYMLLMAEEVSDAFLKHSFSCFPRLSQW